MVDKAVLVVVVLAGFTADPIFVFELGSFFAGLFFALGIAESLGEAKNRPEIAVF